MSWFRAYDLGILVDLPVRDILESGARPGAEFADMDVQSFFDIQTLRRGHVARMRLAPIAFGGVLRLAGGDRPINGEVSVHLLAHASGFVTVRATLRADSVRLPEGDRAAAMNQLERAFWLTEYPLEWRVDGGSGEALEGGGRRLMNWVFLDLFERVRGVGTTPETVRRWAFEGLQGCDRLHRMRDEGLINYPFPGSFGTQFELIGDGDERTSPLDDHGGLARRLIAHGDPSQLPLPIDLGPGERQAVWYLAESHALTLAEHRDLAPDMDVYDADRTQLLECLTLRRAVLRCVQRDTQAVLTERQTVSRGQVERWQHMVATTTDNYILHDRIGRLIEPVRRHNMEMVAIRDLEDLEKQVRENLNWFQERIDTLAEWTGGLIGAGVGAAALVLSLQEPAQGLVGQIANVPADQVVDTHPLPFLGVMVLLTLLSFLLCLVGISRFTSRLTPFTRDRPKARLRTSKIRASRVPRSGRGGTRGSRDRGRPARR